MRYYLPDMISNTGGRRIPYGLITILIILGFFTFLFFYIKHQFTGTTTELAADVMVEKITNMGKLELVKYSMKDVIDKKQVHPIMPDQRILFVAVGEATACIDLTKISKQDIVFSADNTAATVTLPHAEICYVRLDHQRSKVYDISGAFFADAAKLMVEDVYKIADQRLLANAKEMNITAKAEENARVIFKPVLENISGRKIIIRFK